MIVKKCDICGAEMRMTTPRYKVVFDGWLYTEEVNICMDCFKRIAGEIKQADTPHTDKDKVVCPNCGRSDYIRSFEKDFNIKNSGYRYKCINCNTYIKDTPQTETNKCERYVITNDEGEKAYGCMGCQTDCPWK